MKNKSVIKVEKLVKTYINGDLKVTAVKGVSFNITKGEFVAIMGPSGSGKSTMMNVLGCLDKSNDGKYFLDGVDISSLEDDDIAGIRNKKIGFVFQSFNLLPKLSALENVELPLVYSSIVQKQRKDIAKKMLERVGLGDRVHHKPNELSGGQRQRVAIARALINNPAIILADEPTGNLDSHSGEEIMKMFKELNEEGKTIIMVTHEMEVAEKTKRIITFKDGNIISDEGLKIKRRYNFDHL